MIAKFNRVTVNLANVLMRNRDNVQDSARNTTRNTIKDHAPNASAQNTAHNVEPHAHLVSTRILSLAKEVLHIEGNAVCALAERIDHHFVDAVHAVLHCKGRVVVSGMGKSGHIGRKLAATLASTGTPAFFVHPAEARHGDLGMITGDDVVIALSNSGETQELLGIVPLIKRMGTQLIAITGSPTSSLAQWADMHLDAGVEKEACSLNLAPTASTTAALALGDALAVAILDARGFSPEDFARSHPGGALGNRLLVSIRNVMRTTEQLPKVHKDATVRETILEMTAKCLGMTAIVNANDQVEGIFTDGDLRRLLENTTDLSLLDRPIHPFMHQNPYTFSPNQLAVEAIELMEKRRINQILVVDEKHILIGALNMHDLLDAKVV